MPDPSVKWFDNPSGVSRLYLLADVIRYAYERLDRPHCQPRPVYWPSPAKPQEIPPAESFADIHAFAAAMARLVEDAWFSGQQEEERLVREVREAREALGPKCYRVHWRCHTTGREHVANNAELMTLAAAKKAAALFNDGWVVGPIDQVADTATMQRMVDRMHDTISRDLGVAG